MTKLSIFQQRILQLMSDGEFHSGTEIKEVAGGEVVTSEASGRCINWMLALPDRRFEVRRVDGKREYRMFTWSDIPELAALEETI